MNSFCKTKYAGRRATEGRGEGRGELDTSRLILYYVIFSWLSWFRAVHTWHTIPNG